MVLRENERNFIIASKVTSEDCHAYLRQARNDD